MLHITDLYCCVLHDVDMYIYVYIYICVFYIYIYICEKICINTYVWQGGTSQFSLLHVHHVFPGERTHWKTQPFAVLL